MPGKAIRIGWPTSEFCPDYAWDYGPYASTDPPWLTTPTDENGFHRWKIDEGQEVLVLPKQSVATYLGPSMAHWFFIEPVAPWLGCPELQIRDVVRGKVLQVVPPYLYVSKAAGRDRCTCCSQANPPKHCATVAWTPVDAETGIYPRRDAQGREEEPLSYECLECKVAGKVCSRLGRHLEGPMYGKKNGLHDGALLQAFILEAIFALPKGFEFYQSVNTHMTRHFTPTISLEKLNGDEYPITLDETRSLIPSSLQAIRHGRQHIKDPAVPRKRGRPRGSGKIKIKLKKPSPSLPGNAERLSAAVLPEGTTEAVSSILDMVAPAIEGPIQEGGGDASGEYEPGPASPKKQESEIMDVEGGDAVSELGVAVLSPEALEWLDDDGAAGVPQGDDEMTEESHQAASEPVQVTASSQPLSPQPTNTDSRHEEGAIGLTHGERHDENDVGRSESLAPPEAIGDAQLKKTSGNEPIPARKHLAAEVSRQPGRAGTNSRPASTSQDVMVVAQIAQTCHEVGDHETSSERLSRHVGSVYSSPVAILESTTPTHSPPSHVTRLPPVSTEPKSALFQSHIPATPQSPAASHTPHSCPATRREARLKRHIELLETQLSVISERCTMLAAERRAAEEELEEMMVEVARV